MDTLLTSNVKYFSLFWADNCKAHLKAQHPQKWSQYQKFIKDSVATDDFFNSDVQFINTLETHFDIEKPQSYVIDGKIVDKIIGDMLFDPEDEDDEVSKQQALSMFKRNSDSDSYMIEIKNSWRFRLCCSFIACGSTIRLCSHLLQATKEETNLAYLGGSSDVKVRQHVWTAVSISLQNISDAMKSSWTYSAALDASAHQSTSYLDVLIRNFRKNDI